VNPGSIVTRKISVAIVDDDTSVRVSLRRLCEVYGLSASVYASGREFLIALDTGSPSADCLLLDAHMPEMTGLELQRRLVAQGVRIPTIVFTADDEADVPAHYIAAGIVGYLRKPLCGEDLLDAIQRAVRGECPKILDLGIGD
jgi:FixJ family two-component response regulator